MTRTSMECSGAETEELLRRSDAGDPHALQELFARHRFRLLRMVRARLDWRLRGRVDAEDVIQDVLTVAARRFAAYRKEDRIPFFLWLRLLTSQQLVDLDRHHFGAQARDVRREVPLFPPPLAEATSQVIAARLLGSWTTPSRKVARAELQLRVQEALENLEPRDREILVLRHYENLTNAEIAQELGLQESAASKRYFRALDRIRRALGEARTPWEDGTP